ncbi:DUF3488 and transglutaminase-like domain-containing protein [Actinomadura montaniterrae]|uniref:Transglutaminase domain-containing protein n=1 Tax=Actinomadura montaniterrae TaxID=1803903 RepID=A0A6L3VXL7_9ACTN|nr:transglutaminase domain-containing protein [Actinomadura montaniterrae]KAB2385921.1 transglutaminase domain-containing protein [Actinomadura montaniterrae]
MGPVIRIGAAWPVAVVASAAAPAPLLAAGYDRHARVIVLLAVTATVAVAVTAAARRLLRGFGPAAVPAGLPVAAIWLVALAIRAPGPIKDPVSAAVDAAVNSGARILTAEPQAPPTVDLLAFPVLAVWLAAAIATALYRDGHVVPALLPGALLLCGAAVLDPRAARPGYWSAAVLAGAAIVLLSSASRTRQDIACAGVTIRLKGPEPAPARRSRFRSVAAASAVTCAVTLPGSIAAVAAPGVLDGWPIRAHDARKTADIGGPRHEQRNPLAYLSAWSREPNVPLMTVSGPRTELRWVALSEFTGTEWLPDGTFSPAGPALPLPDDVPPKTVRTTVHVKAGHLPGEWVPVPGIPARIDALTVGRAAATGTLASWDGSLAGRAYTATGLVPDWTGGQPRPKAASGAGDERYLRLPPGLLPRLTEIARTAAGEGTAQQRASRIAEYLRESYTFQPGTPSGHGYAELTQLLVPPGRRGGGATSEQFASAFAVLARVVGLPSRVVVGFGPGASGGHDRVVRTGDAVAWGEIHFEGLGWVPYDPSPRVRSATSPQAGTGVQPGGEGAHRDDGARGSAAGGVRGARSARSHGSGRFLLFILPVTFLVLLAGVPLLRLAALRRLRGGAVPDRVLAAWVELLIAMRLAGLPVPASATTSEVSACIARELQETDTAALRRLGEVVNAAGFGGEVAPAAAASTVAQVRSLVTRLRRSRPRWRRMSWWWDPRAPLWAAQPFRLTRWVQTGPARETLSTSTTATTVRQ